MIVANLCLTCGFPHSLAVDDKIAAEFYTNLKEFLNKQPYNPVVRGGIHTLLSGQKEWDLWFIQLHELDPDDVWPVLRAAIAHLRAMPGSAPKVLRVGPHHNFFIPVNEMQLKSYLLWIANASVIER